MRDSTESSKIIVWRAVAHRFCVIYVVEYKRKNKNSYWIARVRDSTESSEIIVCRAVAHRFYVIYGV